MLFIGQAEGADGERGDAQGRAGRHRLRAEVSAVKNSIEKTIEGYNVDFQDSDIL